MDRIKEAGQKSDTINFSALQEKEQGVFQATKGLIEFRKGDSEKGRLLYEDAIKRFQKLKEEKCIALATFYLVREEQRVGHNVKGMAEVVLRLAKKLNLKELLKDGNSGDTILNLKGN